MPVPVGCACGKTFNVKDELAGKKIKCPGCQAVVEVPAATTVTKEVPAPAPARVSATPAPAAVVSAEDKLVSAGTVKRKEPIEDEVDEAPARTGKKKKKKRGSSQNMKLLLFGGLGCGAVALTLFCVVGGVLLYIFVLNPSPERVITGKWKVDFEATRKLYPETEQKFANLVVDEEKLGNLEFKSDGTVETTRGNTTMKAKWKTLSSKGDTATVEIVDTVGTQTVSTEVIVTVKSRNQLHIIRKNPGSDSKDRGTIGKRI